jgi:hypothetical protein
MKCAFPGVSGMETVPSGFPCPEGCEPAEGKLGSCPESSLHVTHQQALLLCKSQQWGPLSRTVPATVPLSWSLTEHGFENVD